MSLSNQGRFRQQVRFQRRQFLQDGDLPFTDVLTEDVITSALAAVGTWLDAQGFDGSAYTALVVPDTDGSIAAAVIAAPPPTGPKLTLRLASPEMSWISLRART